MGSKEGIMPKEYINNRWYAQYAREVDYDGLGNEIGSHQVPLDDSAIKVGWTKDQDHVELAVVRYRDGAEPNDGDWYHSQFDRAGLNRLIRTLRTARDQAFGRDE